MKKTMLYLAAAFLLAAGAVPARAADAPEPFGVWLSSQTSSADTAKTLFSGRGCLHKVIVSSPGASSTITLWNHAGTASATSILSKLTTTAAGEWEFDVALSSGLTYTTANAAKLTMLYSKGNPVPGSANEKLCVNKSSRTVTADTNSVLFTGRGVVKRVFMNTGMADLVALRLHQAGAGLPTATSLIADIDGSLAKEQDFNVFASSGAMYTTIGTGDWTTIYQRDYPR